MPADPVQPATVEFDGQAGTASVLRVVTVPPTAVQRPVTTDLHAQNMTSERKAVQLTCTDARP
ncbi:hypothetical protein AB0953_22230 [Streptomyces sp. NPDC046866]|uniref:hypothetical protein n=1 Tax=Streptomyces sp. NPDC046866 TaxID=3154921 RepID=UPI00345642E6